MMTLICTSAVIIAVLVAVAFILWRKRRRTNADILTDFAISRRIR